MMIGISALETLWPLVSMNNYLCPASSIALSTVSDLSNFQTTTWRSIRRVHNFPLIFSEPLDSLMLEKFGNPGLHSRNWSRPPVSLVCIFVDVWTLDWSRRSRMSSLWQTEQRCDTVWVSWPLWVSFPTSGGASRAIFGYQVLYAQWGSRTGNPPSNLPF